MSEMNASSIRREERLAHRPNGDVWRVRALDGTVMVARQVVGATRGEQAQLRTLTHRGRALQTPVVPFVEIVRDGDDAWLLRAFDPGVPLARLAVRAPLNHRQAAGVAAACVEAFAQLQEAGLCHGRMHAGNVFVEPDGSLRLVDCGIGSPRGGRDLRAQRDADVKATALLLHTVWPDAEYEAGRLVHELLEAGRLGDAAAALEGLELLAGSLPPAEKRPLADLAIAALSVRLLDDQARPTAAPPPAPPVAPRPPAVSSPAVAPQPPPMTSTPATVPAPAMSSPPAKVPPPAVATSRNLPKHVPGVYRWAPARKTPAPVLGGPPRMREPLHQQGSGRVEARLRAWSTAIEAARARAPRRAIAWAAAAVAAIALVIALTHIGGSSSHLAQLTPATNGSKPATHAPAPSVPGAAVLEPAAPASAGIVRQVQLSPVGTCDSGGGCSLQTTLDLQLPHDGTAITWEIVAVDRCTGAQSVLRSSTSTPDPSWQVVWATDQYSLPSTHPLLLYMVTVSPVRVASPPVAVGAPTACRPAQT